MRRLTAFFLLALAFASPSRAAQPDFLAQGLLVTAGSVKARLYASKLDSYRDILIMNPGAQIPALAMSGLAEGFASAGSLVYVLENPGNLPILAPNAAADLAKALTKDINKIKNLPATVKAVQSKDLAIRAIGHSLGGAVLGAETGQESSLFTEIILIGVSRLVSTPQTPMVKVTLLLGEKDGLAARAGVDQLAEIYQTKTIILPGVNHFCIISDPKAGAADKRAQDLPTELSSEECVQAVLKSRAAE